MADADARYVSPFPPYDPIDRSGFSFETVCKRWPVIITNLIDHLYRTSHLIAADPALDPQEKASKLEESKEIIKQASKLKYEMSRDRPLDRLVDDGEINVSVFNEELLALGMRNTWFTAPWLFAECYLYRLFRSWFAQTKHWRAHDPFYAQKKDAFKSSAPAVYQLAKTMHELEKDKEEFMNDETKIEVLFQEMLQICLWGNATDLSLLTNLTHEDIQKLQAVEKDAQKERAKFILKDDSNAAWECVKKLRGGRVDVVLDNAGFELFTDLMFADFLISYTPYVSKVVFHPKTIPWFVSDVTPFDFHQTLSELLDPAFLVPPSNLSAAEQATHITHFDVLVSRWKAHLSSGAFALSVPLETPFGSSDGPEAEAAAFWTGPYAYHHMPRCAPRLVEVFEGSGLVLFKGDLNYRKLTGDVKWPVSTPFSEALGPLKGRFPILSLRTNKADVVVGVDEEVARRVEEEDPKWRVNGRYALISFQDRD